MQIDKKKFQLLRLKKIFKNIMIFSIYFKKIINRYTLRIKIKTKRTN